MHPEKAMWYQLREDLIGYWDATRHEDRLNEGVPDVSFGSKDKQGWIELKALHDWPKKENTIVKIDHYTPQQKIWLLKRGRVGGCCWLLLKVKYDWLLFDYKNAQLVGKSNKQQLFTLSIFHWSDRLNIFERRKFIDYITETEK